MNNKTNVEINCAEYSLTMNTMYIRGIINFKNGDLFRSIFFHY